MTGRPVRSLPSATARDLTAQRVMRAVGLRNHILPPRKLARWKAHPRSLYSGMPSKKYLERVAVEKTTFEGWTVYRVTPKHVGAARRAVLFLHGGAYVLDFTPFPYWSSVTELAEQTGRTIVVPVYPLAPEHTHRDVYPVLVRLFEHVTTEFGAVNVSLVGDSAGGGMVLALGQRLRELGVAQPASIVAISPWVDLAMTHPEIAAVAPHDGALNPEHLANAGRAWAGGDSVDLPILSPGRGSLAGLGHVTMFAGTHDVLWPDARRLHERAVAEGIDHDWYEKPGAGHVWIFSAPIPSPDWTALVAAVDAG